MASLQEEEEKGGATYGSLTGGLERTQLSDEAYSRGEGMFLLFAAVFGFLTCSGFIVMFLWVGFFYHGPYARHFPAYWVILAVAIVGWLAVEAVRLAIEAYRGKVLD